MCKFNFCIRAHPLLLLPSIFPSIISWKRPWCWQRCILQSMEAHSQTEFSYWRKNKERWIYVIDSWYYHLRNFGHSEIFLWKLPKMRTSELEPELNQLKSETTATSTESVFWTFHFTQQVFQIHKCTTLCGQEESCFYLHFTKKGTETEKFKMTFS